MIHDTFCIITVYLGIHPLFKGEKEKYIMLVEEGIIRVLIIAWLSFFLSQQLPKPVVSAATTIFIERLFPVLLPLHYTFLCPCLSTPCLHSIIKPLFFNRYPSPLHSLFICDEATMCKFVYDMMIIKSKMFYLLRWCSKLWNEVSQKVNGRRLSFAASLKKFFLYVK